MNQSVSRSAFWKMALGLAVPIAMQNLLTSCASLIDTAMIVPLGNTAVAAVGVAGRFTFMLNLLSAGFWSGAAALISQFWGANDKKGIRHSFGAVLIASMTTAILFAAALFFFPGFCISLFGPEPDAAALAAQYIRILAIGVPFMMYSQVTCASLRAVEKVSVPLISSFVSVVTNTFLNYCLISGHFGFPALGVRGAAIASVIGALVQAVIVFAALHFGKNPIRANPREYFSMSRAFLKKYAKTAAPAFFNESIWGVGANVYVMVLARQGTEAFSGYTLFETVQQLFFVFFVGICNACAIMVGKAIGRGDADEGYVIGRRFLILTPVMGAVLGAIIIAVRGPLLSLFSIETEGSRATAMALLLFYGCWIGIRQIAYTSICGIFRAGGDTRIGFLFDMVSFAVAIPAVIVAGLVFETPFVLIVMIMYIGEDVPKTVLCIRHFFSRKWIKQLTK